MIKFEDIEAWARAWIEKPLRTLVLILVVSVLVLAGTGATSYIKTKAELTASEAVSGTVDSMLDKRLPVGALIASLLSPSTFSRVAGDDGGFDPASSKWMPADGRDVSGSTYARVTTRTSLPDLRGMFIRGLNEFESGRRRSDNWSDPDDQRKAGSEQGHALAQHSHSYSGYTERVGPGKSLAPDLVKGSDISVVPTRMFPEGEGSPQETRPSNVAVYYYIRIN